MKRLVIGALLLLAASQAMAAGSNLAWNDCLGGGGVPDRTVTCTNSGSGFVYVSLNPSQSYPNVGATDVFLDVRPAATIGSWWNPTPTTTRWGSAAIEPASGVCPAWWAGAPNGGITFQPPQAQVTNVDFGIQVLRIRITTVIAAGEEQAMEPGTEYFMGALQMKFNAGTSGNPECVGGALIRIAVWQQCQTPICSANNPGIVILQPGMNDTHEGDADVSNCVTFQNPPTRQCPGATPTERSTWGSIKVLYR